MSWPWTRAQAAASNLTSVQVRKWFKRHGRVLAVIRLQISFIFLRLLPFMLSDVSENTAGSFSEGIHSALFTQTQDSSKWMIAWIENRLSFRSAIALFTVATRDRLLRSQCLQVMIGSTGGPAENMVMMTALVKCYGRTTILYATTIFEESWCSRD